MMPKIMIGSVTMLWTLATFAIDYPVIEPQQMQVLQGCMKNADRAGMGELQSRAKRVQAEVDALCLAGQSDQARHRALTFATEAVASPALQELRKCGELLYALMPSLPDVLRADQSGKPVCRP